MVSVEASADAIDILTRCAIGRGSLPFTQDGDMPFEPVKGTSAFNILRLRCGLSQREAADFHQRSLNTVEKWCSGTRNVPPKVLKELRALYQCIVRAGGALGARMDALKRGEGEVIEIGVAERDMHALNLGFPCVGAHQAAVGIALMVCDRYSRVSIVNADHEVDTAIDQEMADVATEAIKKLKRK